MHSFKPVLAALVLGLSPVALEFGFAAGGLEFRVDTEVFKNEEKKPILEQLTIFADDGTVYDFSLTAPPETTVFDPRHGRFTLLDETHKTKAVVTTQELLQFCLALGAQAAQQKDRLFAFCAVPEFETTEQEVDRSGQKMIELRLMAKPLSYVAIGQKPQQADAVKAYRHFADWCARLNATRAGNLPPEVRLTLNQSLAERELLPFEITRTIPASNPLSKKLDLRSEHRVNWTLSGEDRKKIDRAADMIATYNLIGYDQYRTADSKPAVASSKQVRR
jgi:hypothetical protein